MLPLATADSIAGFPANATHAT